MLMDSPLDRAGLLQVYIHTEKNTLIEINPQTHFPRTFPRFCGLMVELLHKLSARAADGPQKLLRMIKNPASDRLPSHLHVLLCRRSCLSWYSGARGTRCSGDRSVCTQSGECGLHREDCVNQ